MRVLNINDAARARIAEVLKHAETNLFDPSKHPDGSYAPGDDYRFVAEFDDHKSVFTYTIMEGCLYRHLTVSLVSCGFYPEHAAVCALASEFGFTGWVPSEDDPCPPPPYEWMCARSKVERGVMIVVQEITRQ